MKWSFIDRWPVQDGLVNAFVDLIKKQIEQFPEQQNDIVILFSAHALPMSVRLTYFTHFYTIILMKLGYSFIKKLFFSFFIFI